MFSKLIHGFNVDVLVISRRCSQEITLKHYAHLRSRNDEYLQKKMNRNIKLNFSKETYIDFILQKSGNNSLEAFEVKTLI